MQQTWTRLQKEDAHAVLNKLAGQKDAIVFSREATEVATRTLPFYTRFRLYRLVNYATMPTFSMAYLSNGIDFIPLDGTSNPVYQINERDHIRLNEMNVVPYLDFFFTNVQGSEGDVFLIKDPKRMHFLDAMTDKQREAVDRSFRPLSVQQDGANNLFRVSGTLYYGGSLIAAVIQVFPDGQLAFQEQSLLLSGIHFPHNPYAQHWVEG